MLVLDSGGLTYLSKRTQEAAALIAGLRRAGNWPPVVPAVVLVESLTGRQRDDANVNRLLKSCDLSEHVAESLARRAAAIRAGARRGSAVDALAVATAEPNGSVLTGDDGDLGALAAHAVDVVVRRV